MCPQGEREDDRIHMAQQEDLQGETETWPLTTSHAGFLGCPAPVRHAGLCKLKSYSKANAVVWPFS